MSIEYDEKGKFYTDVVSKVQVPVIIQTTDHLIRGLVHVRKGERLKDELESPGNFTAVTNATVFGDDDKVLFSGPFIAVQKRQIVWILPVDDEAKDADR